MLVTKVLTGVLAAGVLGVLGAPAAIAEKPVEWGLFPAQLKPGEEISADMGGCSPSSPVTSPGFAAPLPWTRGGNFGHYAGSTTVVDKPGEYAATFTCQDGRTGTRSFTILGTPDPTTAKPKPPSTSSKPTKKPTPKPAKPQVAVKPVGAPQTGGGGTADS